MVFDVVVSNGSRIFPDGERLLHKEGASTYYLVNFLRKLLENKRFLSQGGRKRGASSKSIHGCGLTVDSYKFGSFGTIWTRYGLTRYW